MGDRDPELGSLMRVQGLAVLAEMVFGSPARSGLDSSQKE